MSETDDTDELLLIPPDFFSLNPEPHEFGAYYNVVDSLISQVSHLESRINLIESSSEFSVSLLSDMEMQSPRKYNSVSTQSTPQKPKNKYTLSSLPNSPNVKRSPNRISERKRNEISPMLGEIDSFLSNVKLIKRLNAVRNLDNDFRAEDPKKLDLNQVNALLKEVELQDKDIEKPCVREKNWQAGDNYTSVPDLGFGMRKNIYPECHTVYANENLEKADSDSSENTQTTAFNCNYKRDFEGDYNLGLVSLGKLWSTNDVKDTTSFQQKLQEERMRRQHCEITIQQLQNRILELQERVAVAVQVDDAKDKALLKFRESLEKTGSKLFELEKRKENLEKEMDHLQRKLNVDSDENHQKIAHYEKEASLALNMAHSSQDKLVMMEKKYEQIIKELEIAEKNSEDVRKKYLEEVDKNKQYPEILAQKELELNENKSVLAEARKEVFQSKKAVENCQAELNAMKTENERLLSKLEAEKDNNKKLTEQKKKLLDEISAHKNVAKGVQDELAKAREQMEKNKVELKHFYQGQVELVVQNKLKEFQKQLDDAEKALKEELSKKEMSIAKAAAAHIQQISEKHNLEIKLIEEKHQEESRLYQVQVSQLRHELEDSNLKVKRQHEKHVNIEKQLHKFMESLRQDHLNTPEELNSFRSRSFNNLEEILAFNMADEGRGRKTEDDLANGDTPLTSRNEKGGKRKETSLQETIQMLLDRKGLDEQQLSQFYQKACKDVKGKPPWK